VRELLWERVMPEVMGLVLTGGGARAAYQVGALRALAEIEQSPGCPFQVIAGISSGAVNGLAVALGAEYFRGTVQSLVATWRMLTPDRVYRTDAWSLFSIGARWITNLTTGGIFGEPRMNHLLDTAPLRTLLGERLPTSLLTGHILDGRLRAVGITATNYQTGTAITFYQGAPDIVPWTRSHRLGRPESLTIDHVMASAAIPVFFPPIGIDGSFFGDGCMRMNSPLSPAIHLGADRLVAIGIRYARPPGEAAELNRRCRTCTLFPSEIGGTLLNAVFLDSLEADVERLERVNGTLSVLTPEQRKRLSQPLRRIPLLMLRPSRDLAHLAAHQYRRFPRTLRYLLRGIGADTERGWDLVSYLAFEPVYVEMLMNLGYEDTLARRREVEAFFHPAALAA
jgi:NTE family protein